MSADAYPLQWPAGWPRTEQPTRSNFTFGRSTNSWGGRRTGQGAATGAARDEVLEELDRLGADSVVLSTNIRQRKDGVLYASAAEPDDSGVAVYFRVDGEDRCIPCDRWDRVGCNLHAIALTIAALRGLDRWGTHRIVEAAFRGFLSLPAHASGPGWPEVLGLDPAGGFSADDVRAAYRDRARRHHPDRGGDPDIFAALTRARDQALDVARS